MTVKGYLPPEGPKNIHRLPYKYLEQQEAHRLRTAVVPSPEEIILTGRETVHDELERLDLEEVPQEVAEEALSAWQEDSDQTVQDVLDDWQGKEEEPEDSGAESEEDSDDAVKEQEAPDIPEDLEDLDYHDELLPLAKETGASEQAESQSGEDLIQALEEMRDE